MDIIRNKNPVSCIKKRKIFEFSCFDEFSVGLEASPGACMSFNRGSRRHIWLFLIEKKKFSLSQKFWSGSETLLTKNRLARESRD
jgi:hypothetical protein